MGPASEVEIFHDLRGETVTSIITEKTATAREKKNNNTHTPTHTRIVNLQGDKGSGPFNCRGNNRNLQFVN